MGSRGEFRKDWINHKKEDFFDYLVADEKTPYLTYEVRQNNMEMNEERLVAAKTVHKPKSNYTSPLKVKARQGQAGRVETYSKSI